MIPERGYTDDVKGNFLCPVKNINYAFITSAGLDIFFEFVSELIYMINLGLSGEEPSSLLVPYSERRQDIDEAVKPKMPGL